MWRTIFPYQAFQLSSLFKPTFLIGLDEHAAYIFFFGLCLDGNRASLVRRPQFSEVDYTGSCRIFNDLVSHPLLAAAST